MTTTTQEALLRLEGVTKNYGPNTVLNDVSTKLNTDDLIQMNKKADVDKQDPDAIAADWLKSHGY